MTAEERQRKMYDEIIDAAKKGVEIVISFYSIGGACIEFENPLRRFWRLSAFELEEVLRFMFLTSRTGIFKGNRLVFSAPNF